MNTTTTEGVEVKVGQVWRDLDKRQAGRHCKVKAIEVRGYGSGFKRKQVTVALMSHCAPNGSRESYSHRAVQIARMHKGSTGWALVI